MLLREHCSNRSATGSTQTKIENAHEIAISFAGKYGSTCFSLRQNELVAIYRLDLEQTRESLQERRESSGTWDCKANDATRLQRN